MSISKEDLRRMLKEIDGPELSDGELEQLLPHVQVQQEQIEKLRRLDLRNVLPARLMRADARGRES